MASCGIALADAFTPADRAVARGAIYCAYGYNFEKFDEKGLAFLYQDKTAGGEESRFFKLVSRETAADKDHKK